jgi:hypothetical protein
MEKVQVAEARHRASHTLRIPSAMEIRGTHPLICVRMELSRTLAGTSNIRGERVRQWISLDDDDARGRK